MPAARLTAIDCDECVSPVLSAFRPVVRRPARAWPGSMAGCGKSTGPWGDVLGYESELRTMRFQDPSRRSRGGSQAAGAGGRRRDRFGAAAQAVPPAPVTPHVRTRSPCGSPTGSDRAPWRDGRGPPGPPPPHPPGGGRRQWPTPPAGGHGAGTGRAVPQPPAAGGSGWIAHRRPAGTAPAQLSPWAWCRTGPARDGEPDAYTLLATTM